MMADRPNLTENEKETCITGDGNVIGDHNIVSVIKEIKISPPVQRTSLHQIRPPPNDFIGRDDEIRKILTEFEKGATIFGLFGMGGVGKTDLAQVLAENLKNSFADAQFYIDMQGTSKPVKTPYEAMFHVIRSYDRKASLPQSQDEFQGQYMSVLQGQKALILLDNAAGREQVEPLLPPTSCCMLITSLHKFALKGLKSIEINVLSPKDARSLLLANAERIGKGADELAKLCGYMPIALRNAAYVLAECTNLDVAEYAERLKDARKRLSLVDASFDLSYDLLTPDLQAKWSMLSIFPADFDRDGVAAVWNIDLDTAIEGLGELMRWSLVNFYPSTKPAEGRYRLHDLARLYANSRLDPSARLAAQQRHAVYYQGLLWRANDLLGEGGKSIDLGLKMFDREWSNIQAAQGWAKSQSAASSECAEICSKLARAGSILNLRLHPRENISWIEAALACTRQTNNREAEGAYLVNLGQAYAALGETRKAIEYYDRALAIARDIGDRRSEGAALGNLGNAYTALGLGETRKAIEYYEQALAIAREIGDRRNEGIHLGNLGLAYRNLGEMHKAIECHEQALAIAREIGDRRSEGACLGNLGSAFYQLGETDRALDYYNQDLDIAHEIGNRYGQGNALSGQAICYKEMNDLPQAIAKAEEAMKIFEQIESPSATAMREMLSRWKDK